MVRPAAAWVTLLNKSRYLFLEGDARVENSVSAESNGRIFSELVELILGFFDPAEVVLTLWSLSQMLGNLISAQLAS